MKIKKSVYGGVVGVALLAISFSAFAPVEKLTKKASTWYEYSTPADRPNTEPNNILLQFQNQVSGLASRLIPTVVNIYTTAKPQQQKLSDDQQELFRFFFEDFFKRNPNQSPQQPEVQSLGSGFVIHEDGMIITNAHVLVEQADVIKVKFAGDKRIDKLEFQAKILGKDTASDIAVLKIDPPKNVDLPVAPLGNSDAVEVGHLAFVIGNPFGHSETLTMGIISAKSRELVALSPYLNYIQTDAAIHPGNSGGPICNIFGEVVAMSTAIRTPNIGFGIPVNKIKDVVASLIKHGKVIRGWIGIALGPEVDDNLRKYYKVPHGVIVSDVIPGEPAQKAGIHKDDVIVSFNSKDIRTRPDLLNSVAEVPVGTQVSINVWRSGKMMALPVRVAERQDLVAQTDPTTDPRLSKDDPIAKRLGVQASVITPQIRNKHNISPDVNGVVIEAIRPDSPGARSGLKAGDIIIKANGEPITSVEMLRNLVADANERMLLVMVRNSSLQYVWVDL